MVCFNGEHVGTQNDNKYELIEQVKFYKVSKIFFVTGPIPMVTNL